MAQNFSTSVISPVDEKRCLVVLQADEISFFTAVES